ncbi:MAG TPA: glycosyltransferase family 39 protein [Bryobacteraceae bacterium]
MLPTVLLLSALLLAGWLYVHFLEVHRHLWYNPYHDRSVHYLNSLKLATDLRNGHVLQLLHDVNEARVWPPLHSALVAGVLLLGGLDYRLAVLPSLAAWVATLLLGFLTARRAAPRGGNLAGLIAALFLAASPAHRAYATDIMLESLGAALSLLCLYCYLLTVQGHADETWKGRCLGIALLVLFLEKYNYWLLVVLALLVTEGVTRSRVYARTVRDVLEGIDWRRWASAQLRHPLNWAAAAVLLISAYVFVHGEQPFRVAGRSIALYPPHNLIHIAYVLMFLRLAPWWWRRGRLLVRQLDGRLRQVVLWHVCPVAVWFLLPKHLSYFVWYLSLADRAPHQHMDLLGGVRDYAGWFVQDYHLGLTCALAAAALFLAGLTTWRRLRPGGVAVLALVVLAAVLTPTHPNHKARMLHSWVPAVWVTAGLGAAALIHSRAAARWPRLRPWLTGAAVAGVAAIQYPALIAVGHAGEGGPHSEQRSMRDVTDAYLPDLDGAGRSLLLTTMPLKPMAQWTYLERRGGFDGLEERWYGFGNAGEANRRGFADWLRTTDCDTVIFCETTIDRDKVDSGPECAIHAELKDVLPTQTRFRLVVQRDLPHHACRVQIWRRDPSATAP